MASLGKLVSGFQDTLGINGPLDALNFDQYTVDQYTYPIDLESQAHQMVFYINVPEKSKYIVSQDTFDTLSFGSASDIASISTSSIQDAFTKSKTAREQIDPGKLSRNQENAAAGYGNQLSGAEAEILGTKLSLGRKTKRVKKTISLYVPETMIWDQSHQYDTISVKDSIDSLGILGKIGGLAALSADSFDINNISGFVSSLWEKIKDDPAAAGAAFATRNGLSGQAAQLLGGYVINPLLEVLYNAPNLRTFRFDFMFAPRNPQEAENVKNIIKEFRFHSAPEYLNQGEGFQGGLLIPPSEFDIDFLRNDGAGFSENYSIPKISTCVLTQINVNYAPNNQFVTFNDGVPVFIHLQVELQELEMITKELVERGF